ncbi:MAG: DUF1858 domain-containing protein [Candidatus Hodarchaeales archaeon]
MLNSLLRQEEISMKINKDTRVSDILKEYGDIADVMEIFGIKRVWRYSVRRLITKALTVERAARVHRVPLDEFLVTLNKALLMQDEKIA